MKNSLNRIVYVNGDYVKEENAVISVFDRGFIFGDGIYEVVPVINGKLVGAVAEERLGERIKHDSSFPINSIQNDNLHCIHTQLIQHNNTIILIHNY